MALEALLGMAQACPRELWVICLVNLFGSFAVMAVHMALAAYLREAHGFDYQQIGLWYGLLVGSEALVSMPAHTVMRLLTPKFVALIACATFSVGSTLLALASSQTVLAVAVFALCGVGAALGRPLFSLALTHYKLKGVEPHITSLFLLTTTVGVVCAGVCIDTMRFWKPSLNLGNGDNGGSFVTGDLSPLRLVFLNAAVASGVQFIIVLFAIRPFKASKKRTTSRPDKPLKALLTREGWGYVWFHVTQLPMTVFPCILHVMFPLWVVAQLGTQYAWGSVLSLHAVLTTLIFPFLSTHSTAFIAHTRRTVAGSAISAAALLLCCGMASGESSTLLMLFALCMSIGDTLSLPSRRVMSLLLTPPRTHAAFASLMVLVGAAGAVGGGVLVGFLLAKDWPSRDDGDSTRLWVTIALVCLTSPTILTLTSPLLHRQRRRIKKAVTKAQRKHQVEIQNRLEAEQRAQREREERERREREEREERERQEQAEKDAEGNGLLGQFGSFFGGSQGGDDDGQQQAAPKRAPPPTKPPPPAGPPPGFPPKSPHERSGRGGRAVAGSSQPPGRGAAPFGSERPQGAGGGFGGWNWLETGGDDVSSSSMSLASESDSSVESLPSARVVS